MAGDQPLRTGYVEGVATDPHHRRRGFGTTVMRNAGDQIAEAFELGALSTGTPSFYERLGWRPWTGPTFVRTAGGAVPTPDDNGAILFLPTGTTPQIDPAGPLSCEWRPGDVW